MEDTYFRKSEKGQTLMEWLVIVVVLLGIFGGIFLFCMKHIVGNKQIIDFNHQNFNVAYVLGDDAKWEKINIKAWKDWQDSDAIQIVKPDGKAIYTHLRNVKLAAE